MRVDLPVFRAFLAAALLLAGAAQAATADTTLAPGRPAGVQKAQMQNNTAMVVGAAGILGLGMGLALSGTDKNTITSTATTGTTP